MHYMMIFILLSIFKQSYIDVILRLHPKDEQLHFFDFTLIKQRSCQHVDNVYIYHLEHLYFFLFMKSLS